MRVDDPRLEKVFVHFLYGQETNQRNRQRALKFPRTRPLETRLLGVLSGTPRRWGAPQAYAFESKTTTQRLVSVWDAEVRSLYSWKRRYKLHWKWSVSAIEVGVLWHTLKMSLLLSKLGYNGCKKERFNQNITAVEGGTRCTRKSGLTQKGFSQKISAKPFIWSFPAYLFFKSNMSVYLTGYN